MLSGGLSGCMYALIPATVASSAPDEQSGDPYTDDMVLVAFRLDSNPRDVDVVEQMLPIEQRAIEALDESGIGYYDGNEFGDGEFALYFFGADREAMWKLLEPIVSEAPYPLDRAELWPPGSDSEPDVITFPVSAGS